MMSFGNLDFGINVIGRTTFRVPCGQLLLAFLVYWTEVRMRGHVRCAERKAAVIAVAVFVFT